MVILNAKKRDIFGTALTRSREEGLLPVVVYGPKESGRSFFVNGREFEKIYKDIGETALLLLKTPDGDSEVLIHDIAREPIRGTVIHVDFYTPETGKKTTVSIPLHFIGSSPAVKIHGGILVKVLHELSISVLPKNIPSELLVDLSSLTEVGSFICAKDIVLPSGATLLTDPSETIVTISVPEEETESALGDIASVVVEKKGKKEEESDEATG